jgi:U32 family peptidase
MLSTLEILAPAGDFASLLAAINAGADAVYFGVDGGFNARARAQNFQVNSLGETLQIIHDRGCRGYLTLNTLVFDHELPQIEHLVTSAAKAGVDALIIQDIGIARLVQSLVPSLPMHASTQMTCTDLQSVQFAQGLGARRVTLARELSLREIAQIREKTDMQLEVFVHGALCISYSGQCLTSEAIGGRSANRGACAQACRLPYELVVDGSVMPTDAGYLLSPLDLDASTLVPQLLALGVTSIKIEGRLKGPEYVAATTQLYRKAVAAAMGNGPGPNVADRELAAQMFSRGASPGFLRGSNHQQLVDATHCDHIGVELGTVLGIINSSGRQWLRLRTNQRIARGDGIVVQHLRGEVEELGGRVWLLREQGHDVESSDRSNDLWAWLGPDRPLECGFDGLRVFRTSSVDMNRRAAQIMETATKPVLLDAHLCGRAGEFPVLSFTTDDGRLARVSLDCQLQPAHHAVTDEKAIRAKLSRLGETPYRLNALSLDIPESSLLPISSLNRARRALVEQLGRAATRSHPCNQDYSLESLLTWPEKPPPPAGLYVTCRSLPQAESALSAGAEGIYLDFLALTGLGNAVRSLRQLGAPFIGVALPRVRKPGEQKIDEYVHRLAPDALLLRSLGQLVNFTEHRQRTPFSENGVRPLLIADFSLNVANTLSALDILSRSIDAFTPCYDLDAAQLHALLDSPLGPFAEVAIHHPMPLFHMEHCVIAAHLSKGRDYRDCGRPCDTHQISLRDRKGNDWPIEADIGCRNTVLHGTSQSAAHHWARLHSVNVRRLRIELLRESAETTRAIVECYRSLMAEDCSARDVRTRLATAGVRTLEGSLRVLG